MLNPLLPLPDFAAQVFSDVLESMTLSLYILPSELFLLQSSYFPLIFLFPSFPLLVTDESLITPAGMQDSSPTRPPVGGELCLHERWH